MSKIVSMQTFAQLIHKLLRSDRDVNIAVSGFTGEGKSTFTTQLQKTYAKTAGVYWGFDRMTWDRDEMMKWIDGDGDEKKGRLPEYSAILPDELFHMFYRRNWFEGGQIDAISTFNMCRDRHLFVAGNVPNFWNLDGAFQERIRFYAYIPERGVAWVFQQENNPFSKDQWNVNENLKYFRKYRNPYKCPNFIFEVRFPDWDEQEKKEYYAIRNEKRVKALKQKDESKKEVSTKKDRWLGNCIAYLKYKHGMTENAIAKEIGCDNKTIARYYNIAVMHNSMSKS
jgi:hypothetical protein